MSGALRRSALSLAALLSFSEAALCKDLATTIHSTGKGIYEVDGGFWVGGSTTVVWSVLTDYDHLAGFIPSLRTSRITEHRSDSVLVEQVGVARMLGFLHKSVYVLLEVREPAPRILFEEISRKDFEFYRGRWQMAPQSGGIRVDYHLEAKPRKYAPSLIAKRSFRRMVTELLGSVRLEIERRNAAIKVG